MTTIVLRSLTGSGTTKNLPLTVLEVDQNFDNLNVYKTERTSATGSAVLPTGTTAQRDGSPAQGYIRFNTSTTQFEGYDGSGWKSVGGATISDDTTTNSSFYPTLSTSTSGAATSLSVSSTKLSFNPSTGTLTATNLNSSSDANLKINLQTITNSQQVLAGLVGYKFDWKDGSGTSYGVIAQDVEKVAPEIVDTVQGTKAVNYMALIPFLIEEIKKQGARIAELETALNNAE